MAQFRITPDVVREALVEFLNNCDLWLEGKEAEQSLTYVAGARDMANAIIKRYKDGEKNDPNT